MHQTTINKKHHLETLTHLVTNMELNLQIATEALKSAVISLEDVQGGWNGDEPGTAEDMAMAANDAVLILKDVMEKLKEVKELITDL